MDIIGPSMLEQNKSEPSSVGLLATTVEEFADAFEHVLHRMTPSERLKMVRAAQLHVDKHFSEERFVSDWMRQMSRLGVVN